jgi:hypothetical protein
MRTARSGTTSGEGLHVVGFATRRPGAASCNVFAVFHYCLVSRMSYWLMTGLLLIMHYWSMPLQ